MIKRYYDFINEKVYSVFHGTYNDFQDFDYSKIGSNTEASWHGYGFYFSDNEEESKLYGNNIIKADITLNNPIDFRDVNNNLIGFLCDLKGFGDIEYKGKTLTEWNKIITELNELDYSKIHITEGNKSWFKTLIFEYDEKEYIIYNRTETEVNDKKYIKNLFINKILSEKYNLDSTPIRINEIIDPYTFTQIAIKNGYDGAIAHNSTLPNGNEYVVFDKKKIKIIK